MNLDETVDRLSAAAEPSRLRLLVALLSGELTVGDLVTALGQSQPRVSRHLRLLAEAGLVESFREGRSILYRWSEAGLAAGISGPIAALAASGDPLVAGDSARLQKLARQREREALRRALRSGTARGLGSADAEPALADQLLGILGADSLGQVLVAGCGSGTLIRALLPSARNIVGTEAAAHRRQLARARLRQAVLPHWTVRDAQPGKLPFTNACFDLVVLQDVLGAAGSPEVKAALGEAARVLRRTGRLLILDHILPTDSALPAGLAALDFVITRRQWLPGRAPDRALFLATRNTVATLRSGTHD